VGWGEVWPRTIAFRHGRTDAPLSKRETKVESVRKTQSCQLLLTEQNGLITSLCLTKH
jgi:hypothetical protein